MTGEESWLDEQQETTYADARRAFEDLDVEQTAMTRSRTESEIAGMARLARETGERDRARILKLAWVEGSALGTRAFYSFPMGGSTISGPTIQLANALIGVWGDIAVQIADNELVGQELRLTVRVLDLRTGVMQERPHFYTLSAPSGNFAKNTENKSRWMAMQAQSAVSKAIRTTIFNLLPDWVTSTALRAARESSKVKVTPGKVKKAVDWWAQQGVSMDELVALVGEPPDRWTSEILTKVRDLGKAMKDGEVSKAELFGGAPTKPAAQKKAEQPTGADALGGKEPEPKPNTGQDEQAIAAADAAMRSRIVDALTKLGPRAEKVCKMQSIDPKTPVDAWPFKGETLAMVMRFVEGFAGLGNDEAEDEARPAVLTRDELKAAIQDQLVRLGKGRFCEALGSDPAQFEPVNTWRYRANTLVELLAKLQAVEVDDALVQLQARLQEVFDEVSGPESKRDAACWDALVQVEVPEVPFNELNAEQCNTAIEALQALKAKLADQ